MLTQSLWIPILILTSLTTVGPEHEVDPGERLSRYQIGLMVARADQTDLLAAVIDIDFPDEVKRVGQAVASALNGSGYRLAESRRDRCQDRLFELPLPSVHRTLGPLSVRQALAVLAGPGWALRTDQIKRTVWFERVPLQRNDPNRECACD